MVLALIATTGEDQGAAFFAYMGVAAALVFANLGASYGTAKAGVGIASLGVIDSSKITKSLIPIIMAGILGIYGVIVAVLINSAFNLAADGGNYGKGYKIFSGGLCCGLSSLAAGLAIGVAGDAGVRAYAQTEAIFVGMILILIFAECIGLYGMIIAIILVSSN
tara:strand:- start:495 stop:986 length:492 start_codon:yes stop_codon:yes gene_type:complete